MSPAHPNDSSSLRKVIASLALSAAIVGLAIIAVLMLVPGDVPREESGLTGRGAPSRPETGGVEEPTPGEEPVADAEKQKEAAIEETPEPEVPPLLRGTVTGEGAPVPGASVLLFSVRGIERTLDRIERMLPQGELPDIEALIGRVKEELENFRRSAKVAVTAEDGTYEFRGIEPMGYLVLTVADDWMFRYGDVVSLAAGRTEELNVDLPPGEAISGQVVGDAGMGVPGVQVIAEFRPPGMPGIGRIVRRLLRYLNGEFLKGPFERSTAEDGSFSIAGLPPGVYDLVVLRPDGLETCHPGVETATSGVVIHLGRAASVRGYVADLSGAAVPGIRLVAERQEEMIQLPLPAASFNKVVNTVARLQQDRPRRYRTGRDGGFVLAPLAPGRYLLSIDETGFLPIQRSFEVDWGQDLDLGTLRLDRGESLRGMVSSIAGIPIEGAQVLASPVQTNFLTMGNSVSDFLSGRTVTVTDAAGSFVLAGLPRGQYRLMVTALGYAPGSTSDAMTGGEPVTIRLEPGALVTGRVIDEGSGEPVPGARVRASEMRTDTDEEGRFELDGVAPRDRSMNPFGGQMGPQGGETGTTVRIRASARGYLDGEGTLDLAEGGREIVIELAPTPRISGRVLDPDGQPAPGSLVRLSPWISDEMPVLSEFFEKGAIFLAVGVTDLEGRFLFSDFKGGRRGQQYRVIADHPVYARGLSEPFPLEPAGLKEEPSPGSTTPGVAPEEEATAAPDGVGIEVRLERAAKVRGVVTDGSQPVSGATVRLSKARSGDGDSPQRTLIINMLGLPKGGELEYTNQEGRFAYESLRPGTYTLQAEVRGFRDSEPRELTVEAGDEQEVTLIVDPGGEILGIVQSTTGLPVPGARVRLLREPGEDNSTGQRMLEAQRLFGGSYKSTRTAQDGTFSLSGLPDGTYTLIVEKEGYTRGEMGGLPAGGDERQIVLAPAATLRGTVLDSASGVPVTQFLVGVRREGEADDPGRPFRGTRPYSDADGRFSRGDLEEGTYRVEVSSSGFLPAVLNVTLMAGASEEREFYLERAGVLRGSIRDLTTGRPIPGARIELGEAASSGSDSGAAASAGGEEGSRRAERIARAQGSEPGESPGTTDPEAEDERAMGEFFASRFGGLSAESREDGSFTLEGVPDSPLRAVVSHPEYISEVRDGIRVAPGQELKIDLALKAGLEISGTVLDELGEAVAGQWLFIRGSDPDNSWVRKTASTNPRGEFRLGGLAAGAYRLILPPRGGGGGRRTVKEIRLETDQRGLEITLGAE